jgi:TonB-dependent receptor
MKTFTLSLLLLLSGTMLIAQGTLRGRITDDQNVAMPGANVVLESLSIGAVSDLNGFYYFLDIPAGTYDVKVSYIGFEAQSKNVTINSGQTLAMDFNLKPGIMLGEVVIGTQLQGQARALNTQMNNANITNVVSSDQTGKFPDANIGDALKRIPGINVQYDQGEARYAQIRGMEPRFNSFMINGERLPSAEAEVRNVQLDLIPSDMIQTIEVNKAITPDMDADAIGGAVNLVTRQNPAGLRVSATAGSGYNFLSGKPLWLGTVVAGARFAKDRFGVLFSASVQDHSLGSDNIEAEWEEDDGLIYTSDFQVRTYEIRRLRQSYSLGFDWRITENHSLFISGMYNHRNDWENRFRLRHELEFDGETESYIAEISRQDKMGGENEDYARKEDQRSQNVILGGDHLFGKVKFNWHGTYAKASEVRDHERYISYSLEDVEVSTDITDPRHPVVNVPSPFNDMDAENTGGWELNDMTEQNQDQYEKDMNGRFDFSIPVIEGKFRNSIEFGGRYRGKEKERNNDFFEYSPEDEDGFNSGIFSTLIDKTKDNFQAGDYMAGHYVDNEYFGGIDLNNADQFEKEQVNEEYAGNYTAREQIYAGYLALHQNFGEKLFMIAGVRLEQTNSKYNGYVYDEEEDALTESEEQEDNYLSVLPNLHLKYNFNPTTILRFAFTKALARPNYFDLVPYQIIIPEDNEIELGNSSLDPTNALNLDLMFEKYFKSIGLVSAGVYYKDINDFIIKEIRRDYTFNENTWDKYTQPVNGGDATIFGFEIAYQQQANFLPGALKGFGWYLNYTYNHSKVENFAIEGRENEDLPLPGTPENTLNASLFYEYAGFLARVSWNFATSFLDVEGVGETAFYDRYYDKVNYLDVNASYAFSKMWRVFVEVNNLTNQPLRYYQGEVDRTMQMEYYNVRITAGIKFDLVSAKQ